MRWPSEPLTLARRGLGGLRRGLRNRVAGTAEREPGWRVDRPPVGPFAYPFAPPDVRLLDLDPVAVEDVHPEARPHVLHEIGETVYAQARHHWTQAAFGWLWVLGALAAFVLFLFGTAGQILLVTFVLCLATAWRVRTRRPVEALAARVLLAALFLALASIWQDDLHLVPLALVLLALGRAAWLLLSYAVDVFVVTDRRLLRPQGLVFKNRAVMPLQRVLDITVVKPLVGRVLGYGHLVIESAAQDQGLREMRFMPDPDAIDRTIQLLIHGGRPPWDAARTPPRSRPATAGADPRRPAEPTDGAEATVPYRWGASDS